LIGSGHRGSPVIRQLPLGALMNLRQQRCL
jgi:hypothetical protein